MTPEERMERMEQALYGLTELVLLLPEYIVAPHKNNANSHLKKAERRTTRIVNKLNEIYTKDENNNNSSSKQDEVS